MRGINKERVKQLIESGLNDIKVALEVGCSRERVRQIRNYYGLKKNKRIYCSIINETQLAEIMKLVNNDFTVSQIQEKLNLPVCISTLRSFLRRNSIKYKKNYGKTCKSNRWTPALLSQFKEDYNDVFCTYTKLAIKYNISLSRVGQILNYKLNIFPNKKFSRASNKTIKQYK